MIDAILIVSTEAPPAYACTPAIPGPDGLSMIYARADSAEAWAGADVLAHAPYDPDAPGAAVYAQVLADPVRLARYRAFYDPQPVTDAETGEVTEPPLWFGVLA